MRQNPKTTISPFLEKGGTEIINIPKIESKIKEIGPKLKKELKKTPKIKKRQK